MLFIIGYVFEKVVNILKNVIQSVFVVKLLENIKKRKKMLNKKREGVIFYVGLNLYYTKRISDFYV